MPPYRLKVVSVQRRLSSRLDRRWR